MIKKEGIALLAKVYGKSEAEVVTAIKAADEVDLGTITGEYYTKEENEQRNTNNRAAGIEIGIKQVYDAAGITFSASEKTPAKVVEKLKAEYANSGDAALKTKITDLEKQISEMSSEDKNYGELKKSYDSLKQTYEKEIGEWETKYTGLEKKTTQNETDRFLMSTFPEKTVISREDLLLIARNKYTNYFQGTDGKWYAKNGEEIVKDKIGNPVPAETLLKAEWEDKYVQKEGAGSPDGSGGNFKKGDVLSAEDARKYIKENTKLELTSAEGLQKFNELTGVIKPTE